MHPTNFRDVCVDYFTQLATPLSLTLANHAKEEDWRSVVLTDKPDPRSYTDSWSYHKDALAVGFLRKCAGLPTGVDLEAAAIRTFHSCEAENVRTNQRLYGMANEGFFPSVTMLRFVDDCRALIASVLGRMPDSFRCVHGKGSTFSDIGNPTVADKMSTSGTRTEDCPIHHYEESAWARALAADPLRAYYPEVVKGNRFSSVPKDSTKNRGIGIEPSINLALQLGIGAHLKDRLLRVGLDLRKKSAPKHVALAKRASMDLSYATLDCSNASDTISLQLVKLLLPEEWFDLLDCCRSKFTFIGGEWFRLAKFSSMGNGFTFELETLIFWAIARVTCQSKDVFAYGDDLIVPDGCARAVISAFRFFGFTLNEQKCFFGETPFRESCGGDYFSGVRVTPVYVREVPTEPSQYRSLHNKVREGLTAVFGPESGWEPSAQALLRGIVCQMPISERLWGPVLFGDTVLHSDDHINWRIRVKHGRRQIKIVSLKATVVSWDHWRPEIQYACALYGTSQAVRGSDGSKTYGLTPRGLKGSYSTDWVDMPSFDPVCPSRVDSILSQRWGEVPWDSIPLRTILRRMKWAFWRASCGDLLE